MAVVTLFTGRTFADCIAQPGRLGWTPSHLTFDRNPLDVADEAARAGRSAGEHIVDELRAGRLHFADTDPDNPANFPRVMAVWRANLLGSSGKGMEYFMRHLLGIEDAVRAPECPQRLRPAEVRWRDEAPRGKLDLVTDDIELDARVRIDTPGEADYYRHGGIMQYVLRQLLGARQR